MPRPIRAFKALTKLLLAVCLSISAALPAAAEVTVIKPTITVPTFSYVLLDKLISAGAVDGIDEDEVPDYLINMEGNQLDVDVKKSIFTWGYTGQHITNFTNTKDDTKSFSITFNVLPSPSRYLANNIYPGVYVGKSRTFEFEADMFPLSDYTSIEIGNSLSDITLDYNNNSITITGVNPGKEIIDFHHAYGMDNPVSFEVFPIPSLDDLKINDDNILVEVNQSITLPKLINAGYIEGINSTEAATYFPSSSDNAIVYGGSQFYAKEAGTYTITFTNSVFPDVSFDITVTAKIPVTTYLMYYLGVVYIDKPKTIVFPEDVMPLSEYERIYIPDYQSDPDAEMNIEVDTEQNSITFIGIKPGRVAIYFDYTRMSNSTSSYGITVCEAPSPDDIKLIKDNLSVPTQTTVTLNMLKEYNVVESAPGNYSEYMTTSPDTTIVLCNSNYGYFNFLKPGKAPVTFIHKEFPEVNFTINVTAELNPRVYIGEQLGYNFDLYVGESKTIVIPDDYMSLNAFTLYKGKINAQSDADFDMTVSEDGREISFIGLVSGMVPFTLRTNILDGGTMFYANVKIRESVAEVIDGNAVAGTQIGVPVTIALPDDIDISPVEGTKIVWSSEDEEIASVDPETGEIVAKHLGMTHISVKRLPDNQTDVTSRTESDDKTLITIEFWVTELELPEDVTIKVGHSQQIEYNVNAGDKSYPYDINPEWSSSNTEVATIDPNGVVTGVSEGTSVITLSTKLGTKQLIVTVTPDDSGIEAVTMTPADSDCKFECVYDIQGRIVVTAPEQMNSLKSGIYIQGGKKFYLAR